MDAVAHEVHVHLSSVRVGGGVHRDARGHLRDGEVETHEGQQFGEAAGQAPEDPPRLGGGEERVIRREAPWRRTVGDQSDILG